MESVDSTSRPNLRYNIPAPYELWHRFPLKTIGQGFHEDSDSIHVKKTVCESTLLLPLVPGLPR